MKIHHLRNATFVIESGEIFLLIDPMLSKKEGLPPFSILRHKPRKNPTVSLPGCSWDILEKVNYCLITHCQKGHVDHLDRQGKNFLHKNNISVLCTDRDKEYLKERGVNVQMTLGNWKTADFLGGDITAIPAQHGHGWIHHFMANGIGYFIQLPNEPSIYISSDTVLTEDVKRALLELKPDISVVAAGYASVDIGKPILMSLEEIIEFIRLSPNQVIANHLEALNHCPMTRTELRRELDIKGLSYKTIIPNDGESIEL